MEGIPLPHCGIDRSSNVGGGGMISDFKKETTVLRGCGCGRGMSHGREIFQFWGSESCNLVHAVMRFLTLYLIRIWIKILPYSRTHTETGSE